MKDIGIKEIKTNIPNDAFVSHIEGIIGNVKNVIFEGSFSNMHVYELEKGMIALFDFTDKTGTIPALMFGSRNKNFKDFLESIIMTHTYKVQGNVRLVEEADEQLPFSKNLLNKNILAITAIDDLADTKLFGVDIVKLYNYDVSKAYNFVKDNTDYLNDISIDEVKDIEFSATSDIIILLNNGDVILNGELKVNNIKLLVFLSGLSIFGISNENQIIPIIGSNYSYSFINNNNYKYKKILINPLVIIALTNENNIRLYGTVCDGAIDSNRLIDVEDIGYIDENDDIVVIKDSKPYSLFYENDYSNDVPEVMIEGTLNDVNIVE
nr:hypothetical protein [Bacilli bacterium]